MKHRIEELVEQLNRAARAYYQSDREIMSNQEYDKLYDELADLEKESGIVMSNSPTVKVGYEVLSNLPKEAHPSPMLSLDKTKEVSALEQWLGDKEGLLSWKLDGLTVVLTYEGGQLAKAVTRGDGNIGEVITSNARTFVNIPLSIPEKGQVVIRGEAVISYPDFEMINVDGEYKNPRNLCSGSVRQLNSRITAERNVRFYAFALARGPEFEYRHDQNQWMESQGFQVVDSVKVNRSSVSTEVGKFSERISDFEIPSDGLVLIYDDIEYGNSLGTTAKFPRDAIAFKWQDELKETELSDVIWNPSRTGLINPIAIFEPVELEGTTVSRASVHNLSQVYELALGIGDKITVYKANMIIPQIGENKTRSGSVSPPDICPVCGSKTEIHKERDIQTLHCPNADCPAKKIKSFTLFVSRNALNIEGLSEATIEKMVDEGIVKTPADLFRLENWKDQIVAMDGFGEKSYNNLVGAAKTAGKTTPERLLYGLGIPNIGVSNAKMIARACQNSWKKIQELTQEKLTEIEGVGDIMAKAYVKFFDEDDNKALVKDLLEVLDLDEGFVEYDNKLEGKTFVITGSLNSFKSRNEAKARIEELGGKVAGSVSQKTDYLINNDRESNSSKNKKAKELDIPIITEEEFISMIN